MSVEEFVRRHGGWQALYERLRRHKTYRRKVRWLIRHIREAMEDERATD